MTVPLSTINRVPREGELSLSYAQHRLWFLHQLEPNSSSYNRPKAVRLSGALNVTALERSLREVVGRHEILRTTFPAVEGHPLQVIALSLDPKLVKVDLQQLPESEREAEARRLVWEEARRSFDLALGPLLRAMLLCLGEEEHLLLLTTHHIVFDGWSEGVLLRELGAFYDAFSTDSACVLSELPIQYADFAGWQRQWLEGQAFEKQLDYWKRQLRDAVEVLDLPTDRPRPAVQSFRGSRQSLRLSGILSGALKAFSRREGVTLFTTLLAAFQTLLHRYTGQTDIVVGSPVAGRTRIELEGLIGLFVNTLVMRADLSGDPSFRQLLGRVWKVALGSLAHQDFPFEKLVEALRPKRSMSHTPLFQVAFQLRNVPKESLELRGLKAHDFELDIGIAKFDLAVEMVETSQGLFSLFEYNNDLFDDSTIARMLGHFEGLLESIAADPEQRLSALPILANAERHHLLVEWNNTQADYPKDHCIHQLFEAQAQETPDALAVVFRNQSLTYGGLNRRANQLAHHLQNLGVGPEVLVGICVERSVEMVVGLLGILKTGGAYVPLDPASPRDRLSFMMEDARVTALLTQEPLLERLPKRRAGPVTICLDSDWEAIACEIETNLASRSTAENLAYVIYTSGSTGQPKGVEVQHAGLVNLVRWHQREYQVTTDRATQLAGLAFDACQWELWPYLLAGASIHIPDEETRVSAAKLVEWLTTEAIDICFLPTPLAVEVLQAKWPSSVHLRALLTGGDVLQPGSWREVPFSFKVFNHYGPTESTVVATWAPIETDLESNHPPTIGRPIANTQIYLLDSRLQVVPIGVAGELCIGGVSLARSYLNRPDLTAEKFIPNPFSDVGGSRLYRSGDLARYQPNGDIEFLGRIDHQVKIRGFRIELGEIEAVLSRHPTIREAVVLAREDVPGEKHLVAYLVPKDREVPTVSDLRSFLKEKLPDYMVPSAYVMLTALPLSPNGKVDRRALPTPEHLRPELEAAYVMPTNEVERAIAGLWQEMLSLERVGIHDNFFDLGGHSLLLAQLQSRLRGIFDHEVSLIEMFEYPTVSALARYLSKDKDQYSTSLQNDREGEQIVEGSSLTPRQGKPCVERPEIAIIGMACRFPGAKSVDEFWHNLSKGLESITSFSDEELKASGVEPELLKNPTYVKSGALLEGIELFDASFFGFNAREAEVTDPQHRLFLECAWEAFENAGYDSERYNGLIGMFAGASMNSYLSHHYINPNLRGSPEGYQLVMGNDKDFVATRVSYKLGLKGPSVNVQTACSTSLVAVHLASQSLLNGECDMALAGGVSIYTSQKSGYLFHEGMIYSPDGHCRAFDARARGTIGGNGLGIVVLKRLTDAVRDGDTIRAVIKGSSINNDGSLKVGYTAPSVNGQADVIKAALMKAGITAETVGYIEAHGTGTELGDPIEIAALTKAFRASTNRTGFCGIGSAKTNIGHLNTAAGMAGLIKVVLALKNRQLPASLHFEQPNPKIDFDHSPFYVVTKLTEWEPGPIPRRAGVSSFGIGGTNAHLVLEEAPVVGVSDASRPWQLLLLSAKTKTALDSSTLHLSEHLRIHRELNLADVAYTLKLGRRAFKHRRMLVCRDVQDALSVLENLESNRLSTSTRESDNPSVVFMFSGQGSQYVNMALELYRIESIFRDQVDACSEFLRPHLGFDLREVLFPEEEHIQKAAHQLTQTATTQPALFVIEYALAKTLMDWGVTPVAMIGHSIGEYVAACLAGVFSLEDALTLVAERGRLMNQLPGGSMLAVPLTEEEVRALLGDELSIATVNAPSLCVVSGPTDAVDRLDKKLTEKGLETVRLLTSHAFHSSMMEPVLKLFTDQVRKVKLSPPKIPCLSNVTGTWMTAVQATDPEYWARQVRQTVRFSEGLHVLTEAHGRVFLEIGPGRTLGSLAKQHVDEAAGQIALSSLRQPKDERHSDLEFLLRTLGQLWLAGIWVDWAKFYAGECRRRLPLPTYPFERERYWVEPQRTSYSNTPAPTSFKKPDISDWFYIPSWKRSTMPPLLNHKNSVEQELPWLIFDDGLGLGSQIVKRLQQLGLVVTMVRVGEKFRRASQDLYLINPRANEDYVALFRELGVSNRIPGKIVHLWCVSPSGHEPAQLEHLEKSQDLGLYSLLYLAQATGELSLTCPFRVAVVSNNVQEVTGEESLCPEKATVLGPCKIIPSEYPNIGCRSVDVVFQSGIGIEQELIDPLLAELSSELSDPVVAYRGKHRWVQTFEPIQLKRSSISRPRLREKGVYLVTGGLGGIGMALAEYLARTLRAKLVLTGRSEFPARDEWGLWLSHHDVQDAVSMKIQKLKSIEALGAEILVVRADASDLKQMQGVIAQTKERFERINGVIHSAGIADYAGVIQNRSREMTEEVLSPKVKGTLVLDTVLRGIDLDFFVLCSSLGSVLYHSKFGQVAYNAANEFLDAFACHKTRRDGTFTVAVNWTDWQEAGMSVDAVRRWIKTHGFPDDPSILQSALSPSAGIRDSMLSSEGAEAFERVLANQFARVVVSTQDLGIMMKEDSVSVGPAFMKVTEQIRRAKPKHPRPQLSSSFVAPSGKVEQTIAKIWQELIGFEELGIHDNFFELGGDSLLATRVISRLRNEFQLELSLKTFFDDPTVADIASIVTERQVESDKEAAGILAKVESLSGEEARSLLVRDSKRS